MYSNSSNDTDHSDAARHSDESAVRAMYEFAPYPGLGDNPKDLGFFLSPIEDELKTRKNLRFLDVGCGTGHIVVGAAKSHPEWTCCGIDLSAASLKVAGELAELHDAEVTLHRGSYLDPLPFDDKFDVISAIGTIHHSADPDLALKNITTYLKNDGYILMHMYGMRCDQEKFDIKEALSIMEPELSNYDDRFRYYRALHDHRQNNLFERIARTSLADVVRNLKNWWRNVHRRRNKVSWSPSFRENYTEVSPPWIDHFCHPCERAYEVPEMRELVDAAGLEVAHMINQGREDMRLIPPAWRERYSRLDPWDKWRLSELLSPGDRSFAMILRRKRTA